MTPDVRKSRRVPVVLALAGLLLAALACTLLPGRLAPGAATQPAAGGPGTPASALSGDQTYTGSVTYGAGPFTLADPKVGLADLSSYSATLALSFAGTVNNRPA